jgi:2-polyprenyl-3-methyl-5-hydroxy-6-metoxy-1,4-benzoquinol methylase
MITLICGPSGAGKSTFYELNPEGYLDFNKIKIPLLFPDEVDQTIDGQSVAFHYNILRLVHERSSDAAWNPNEELWDFGADSAWRQIRSLPGQKRAVVLLSSPQELLSRAESRALIEPRLRREQSVYPNDFWTEIYKKLNLLQVYQSFIRELESLNIDVEYFYSINGSFSRLSRSDAFSFIRQRKAKYSWQRIANIIKSPIFEYQRIELPYGLATRGQDRSATVELTLPNDLRGCSVLDIGSALGLFAFQAEKRGAVRVVGLEPRESRFHASVILKEILGSSVEFRLQNIMDFSVREQFDRVLLLNVIHHLKDPIGVLLKCAELTRGELVIEFPQLDDPLFGGLLKENLEHLNTLPLIGVSSRAVDQTYIFTAPALEKILLDHHKAFQRCEIATSPMPHRVIMTFYK